MEFVITKYNYYLPFKNDTGEIEGLRREHISVEGVFINGIDSPNQKTRDLLSQIKVDYKNTKNSFNFYIGSKDEFKELRNNEDSKYVNTKINLKADANSQSIEGQVYLNCSSFDELKSLISVLPNSNCYLRFETVVFGDKIKNQMPIEIELHSHTCGIEMSFPIQQPSIKHS